MPWCCIVVLYNITRVHGSVRTVSRAGGSLHEPNRDHGGVMAAPSSTVRSMARLPHAGDSPDRRRQTEPDGSRAPDARWQPGFVRTVAARTKPVPFRPDTRSEGRRHLPAGGGGHLLETRRGFQAGRSGYALPARGSLGES